MEGPVHGKDGWTLIEYDWDEEVGWARLTYERIVDGRLECFELCQEQRNFWISPEVRAQLALLPEYD